MTHAVAGSRHAPVEQSAKASLPLPARQAVVGANVGLWWWAQQHAPAKPKKKLGAKQAKRETLKRGLALPQD
jgi:hypothetical protein